MTILFKYNDFMLVRVFKNLKENKIVNAIRRSIDSIYMMIAIILLAAISNVFALEIPVYYIYTLIIVLTVLFCDDLLAIFPMPCCGYMTFARSNNPLSKEATSSFLNHQNMIHMLIIGTIISVFLITRIIFDIVKNKERRQMPKLLYGFIAIGIAYLLGGIFSEGYGLDTVIFGLIQILSLSFTYIIFYYTIDWKRVSKNYFPILFILIGCLMVVEIFNMLIEAGLFNTEGAFNRGNLFTGWGVYNNVACISLFTIPAPFYFAITKKNGWMYSLIGTVFLIFTILTQSRNGMLMGAIIYCICALVTLFATKGKERIKHLITYLVLFILLIVFLLIFKEIIENVFASIYKVGTDDSGRIDIYKNGLEQFKESFVFGKGFYECDAFRWGVKYESGDFLPPRYHNTYVQILASCGIVGMVAYLYHRYQTIKLIYNNMNAGNAIISITILGFLMISVFDCHFHNFGPGLIYSALLLLSEKVYSKK